MRDIRSLAGRVLRSSKDPEVTALAAYVLGDEDSTRTTERNETMTTQAKKTDKTEDKVETVEVPAPIIQPIAGGAAPADVEEGREAAKKEVREAIADRESDEAKTEDKA